MGALTDRMGRVLVVGGGPAGCVVSRLLHGWGVDVVLIARPPSAERTLAESIPPSGVRLLERVGMLRAVDAEGFVRSSGNTVQWGAAERIENFPPGTFGYQVERSRFDATLLHETRDSGVPVVEGTVTAVERSAIAASVSYTGADGPAAAQGSWILDCSGRAGVLAKQGWRASPGAVRTIAIAATWERAHGWPLADVTHTAVESFEGGWAWSIPVSRERRYVTLMLDPRLTPVGARDQLLATYETHLARASLMSRLTAGATRTSEPFAREASPYHARRYAEQGAVLVGDAGSFVDPLSSFGIKKALASAWLAAVVVRSAIDEPALGDAALGLMNERERAMFDALSRQAATLARAAASAEGEGGEGVAFWDARAEHDALPGALDDEPDVSLLRVDGDVLASLSALRSRETVRLSAGPAARRQRRATVRANRVVIEDHLVVPAFPRGIRYVRNVDLVRLAEIAPAHGQVPDLYDAYNRSAPPCALPDFLGALSLLIGKGALILA